MSNIMLAKGDLFELIGPLLLFGIYAIGVLAKKWASSQGSDSGDKSSQELQKAVREKYKQIHDRQMGKAPEVPKFQPQRKSELPRPVPTQKKLERPEPVRQVTKRRTVYPVQMQQHRSVRQKPRTEPYSRSKTDTVITQTPNSIHIPKTQEKIVPKTIKHKDTELSIMRMIWQPKNLRSAIILKEILDKPVSLRNDY